MELRDLYGFVLLMVLVGLILGIGVLIFDKFEATAGMTSNASTILNYSRDAIQPIASDWMPLIVTVAVLSVILVLVIGSFGART